MPDELTGFAIEGVDDERPFDEVSLFLVELM
jgi:hypothetical protein